MAGRGRPLQIEWHESEAELYEHYRREKDSQRRMRRQALWQLRQGKSLGDVQQVVGISYRPLQRWVRLYRQGGLALVVQQTAAQIVAWSRWRRHHQAVAKFHHYKRRNASLNYLQL